MCSVETRCSRSARSPDGMDVGRPRSAVSKSGMERGQSGPLSGDMNGGLPNPCRCSRAMMFALRHVVQVIVWQARLDDRRLAHGVLVFQQRCLGSGVACLWALRLVLVGGVGMESIRRPIARSWRPSPIGVIEDKKRDALAEGGRHKLPEKVPLDGSLYFDSSRLVEPLCLLGGSVGSAPLRAARVDGTAGAHEATPRPAPPSHCHVGTGLGRFRPHRRSRGDLGGRSIPTRSAPSGP